MTLTPRALGAHTANETPRGAAHLAQVRAELVVNAIVFALGPQMQIEVADASADMNTDRGCV